MKIFILLHVGICYNLQIEEKQYEAELIAEGFLPGQIYKYGFAFCGKECLIG